MENENEPIIVSTASTGLDVQQRASKAQELEAFNKIIAAIDGLPEDTRSRVFATVATFLGYSSTSAPRSVSAITVASPSGPPPAGSFSEDRSMSAKEFMLEKRPITDVERIACLAYYLTHYRSTPHFKTLDLSKLNTEAAQIKFSNAAKSVDNAAAAGLLVPAGKGNKQISALGELYVRQLPDREAAKAAIAHARPRKKARRNSQAEGTVENAEDANN